MRACVRACACACVHALYVRSVKGGGSRLMQRSPPPPHYNRSFSARLVRPHGGDGSPEYCNFKPRSNQVKGIQKAPKMGKRRTEQHEASNRALDHAMNAHTHDDEDQRTLKTVVWKWCVVSSQSFSRHSCHHILMRRVNDSFECVVLCVVLCVVFMRRVYASCYASRCTSRCA